jgi:hypothetical protein
MTKNQYDKLKCTLDQLSSKYYDLLTEDCASLINFKPGDIIHYPNQKLREQIDCAMMIVKDKIEFYELTNPKKDK